MPKKTPPRSKSGPNRNLIIALVGGALVVAAIVVGVLVLGGGSKKVDASSAAYFDGIPQASTVLGSPSAKVTLIQFEDLQCPICREYTQSAQQDIVQAYVKPGKIKMRFAGLAFIGTDSQKALRYSLAAGVQGKLWQFNELLYENQGAENSGWVTDSLLEQIANALGLDWAKLQKDQASAAVTQQMNSMETEAQQLQVSGTPTFFIQIGNQAPYKLDGLTEFSLNAFRPSLDDALNQ